MENYIIGFSQVMNLPCILLCLLGTFLGIFFGASPGMTSSMGIALALPLTYSMGIVPGMALLLGIYIGSISGGLITAILINIPGTPASVATTFDGHPMALRGEGRGPHEPFTSVHLEKELHRIDILFDDSILSKIRTPNSEFQQEFLLFCAAITRISMATSPNTATVSHHRTAAIPVGSTAR